MTDNTIFVHEFTAMACLCQITLAGTSQQQARVLALQAENEVRQIEQKYSRYRLDGVIHTINKQAGIAPVECDNETRALLANAAVLYEFSNGLFDITSGVLRKAWKFENGCPPDPEFLRDTLALVGWEKVVLTPTSLFLPQVGMELDFGGFGKEYAADSAAQLLIANGLLNGFVNLGGDIRVIGPKPDGAPWSIGIRHPRRDDKPIASLTLRIGALATSGDYERYFDFEGRRYCHVLNPKTGQPAQAWQSISVLASDALSAGSLSTIAMLMDEDGLEFLRGANVDFLAVSSKGEIYSEERGGDSTHAEH